MTEEHQSIMKNDVWDIVPRPEGMSIVTSKWIYKIKHATDESVKKYKTRFVAKGFSRVEGIDYEETFSPVARYNFIHTIITLATSMGWKLHQMDVKTAFLNGEIEEEVYIKQPEGFMIHESATDSLDSSETCIEIFTRHSWIWPEICLQCKHEIVGIGRCRLGKEHSGPEEHIRLLFYIGVFHGFLVQQETELCGFEYRRSRVYSVECGSL
jgi:hypothetical protein